MLEADLAAVDLACSRFRPDSEIVALDRLMTGVPGGTGAEPVEISPLLAEAIAVALRAARLTDGDVDPTVGAAMNAAGYDRDFSLVQREGPAVKLTVRTIPGWRQVEFDESTRRLRIPPGARLDLGATAKACVTSRSARYKSSFGRSLNSSITRNTSAAAKYVAASAACGSSASAVSKRATASLLFSLEIGLVSTARPRRT